MSHRISDFSKICTACFFRASVKALKMKAVKTFET
jgi:hypothetical protein